MDKNSADVIVVGGGPAGSSAAYFLCRAGLRVLVLEKERLPRYKTCGGGLSLRFLRSQFPFSFDSLPRTQARAISYAYRGHIASLPLEPGSIDLVMRTDLDAYLLSQSGAEVVQETVVRGVAEREGGIQVETQDGRVFTAAYLIGADGANSVVARQLGMRPGRTLAGALEAEVTPPPEAMRRFRQEMVLIFGAIPYGYLWIFPKGDHLTVGIGALHPRPGQLQKVLMAEMARLGIPLDGVPLRGHPIPFYTRRQAVASGRVLLVGDAAGLADPLSGEGIRFAIKSGRLAAEALAAGQPEGYQRALDREIGRSLGFSYLVSHLFYALEAPCLFLGAPNPFCTQGIAEMLADRMSMPEFMAVALGTLPVFAFTELAARLLQAVGMSAWSSGLRQRVYPRG